MKCGLFFESGDDRREVVRGITIGELIKELIDASKRKRYGMDTPIYCSATDDGGWDVFCEIDGVDDNAATAPSPFYMDAVYIELGRFSLKNTTNESDDGK